MIKVDLAGPEGDPGGSRLVPEQVSVPAAPRRRTVRVDQQRVGPRAGDQHDPAGVARRGQRAAGVAHGGVAVGQVRVHPLHALDQLLVRLLPLAPAETEAEALQLCGGRRAGLLQGVGDHLLQPVAGLLHADDVEVARGALHLGRLLHRGRVEEHQLGVGGAALHAADEALGRHGDGGGCVADLRYLWEGIVRYN